jgi:hypothetical protein
MAKAKGSFTANVSSGSSVGFSGIPGKGNYSAMFGQQFGKSFGKAYDKAKAKPGKVVPPKPGETGSGLSSEDNVTGDKPTRPQRKAIENIYEGEVVEQTALPSGRPALEDIIDAEVIETPKAIGGSPKAIAAPPLKALPAPKAPRASSPVRGSAAPGKQFTSVDKSGTATPMAKTPYGDAVRLD